jgi:KDO2-lipid IV(A) lauroyltransferase
MSNEGFGNMVIESRSRFGATLIPMNDTYDFMNKNVGENAFALGLFPDQSPIPMKGYWMEFLGRGTPVYRGPENLARKFDMPVFVIDIDHKGQGYCHAQIELITETPLKHENGWITEEFMKRLETKIKERPQKYLWSHKRWKHSIPTDLPENQISKRYPPPKEDKIDY